MRNKCKVLHKHQAQQDNTPKFSTHPPHTLSLHCTVLHNKDGYDSSRHSTSRQIRLDHSTTLQVCILTSWNTYLRKFLLVVLASFTAAN